MIVAGSSWLLSAPTHTTWAVPARRRPIREVDADRGKRVAAPVASGPERPIWPASAMVSSGTTTMLMILRTDDRAMASPATFESPSSGTAAVAIPDWGGGVRANRGGPGGPRIHPRGRGIGCQFSPPSTGSGTRLAS